MIKNFQIILADNKLNKFIWLDIVIVVLFVVLAIWKLSSLPPQLPLFYSLPRSPEQLGTPLTILILPLFSIIFAVVDITIASFLHAEEKVAATILVIMSSVVSLLLFITYIKIVFLVS